MQFCKVEGCEKQVFGGGYCSWHQWKRKKSDESKQYSREAKQFKKGQKCKAKLPGCTKIASDVHHLKGRGKNLMNKKTWIPLCRNCHSFIETHPTWAKENGFAESRLNIINPSPTREQ